MLKRLDFLSVDPGRLKDKFSAYQFESGRKGLSAFFLNQEKVLFVVGKDGNAYRPQQWPKSKTFWIAEQGNLLVSDNQTCIYDVANEQDKKQMTKLAWGI